MKKLNERTSRWVDFVKCICTLYIVGFWHIYPYIGNFKIANVYTRDFALTALASFYLLSGFCTGNIEINDKKDIIKFFRRRFRWYPIYFIACISMMIIIPGEIPGYKSFVLSLVGVSCVIGPAPSTIWFYSLLYFCYLITPILLYTGSQRKFINVRKIFLRLLIIYTILLVIDSVFHCVDRRTYAYILVYTVGITARMTLSENIIYKTLNRFSIVLYATVLYALFLFIRSGNNGVAWTLLIVANLVIILLSFTGRIAGAKVIERISGIVTEGALVAYLFHRQYYTIVVNLTGHLLDKWQGFLIVLPLLLLFSRFFQQIYVKRFLSLWRDKIGTESRYSKVPPFV